MALSVYNTLSNSKEKFVPTDEGKVKLYLCGPSPKFKEKNLL